MHHLCDTKHWIPWHFSTLNCLPLPLLSFPQHKHALTHSQLPFNHNYVQIERKWVFILFISIELTILCYFQLYNIVNSDTFVDYIPYKVITVFFTIFPVLYITSLWFIYFIIDISCPLTSFTCLVQPAFPSPLATTNLFSVSVSLSLFYICLFWSLDSTYMWRYTVFVFDLVHFNRLSFRCSHK